MGTNDYGCIFATAGETITAGAACYLSAGLGSLTAGRAYLATTADQYSSTQADLVGIATAGALAAAPVRLRVLGIQDGFSGLVAGQTQYVSTGGAITATMPATNARALGIAISANEVQLTSTGGGTDLAPLVAPTLSASATGYSAITEIVTISNWSTYLGASTWACVRDSGGTVVTAPSTVVDNGDGTLNVPMPGSTGTFTIQVKTQQFGTAPSKITEHEIVLSVLPSYRYYRISNLVGTNASVARLMLFTGVGPGPGTAETHPVTVYGTEYPTSYMTAPALPVPYVASASFEYSATYAAWKAFNSSTANSQLWWALGHGTAATLADWLMIDLGPAAQIRSAWLLNYDTNLTEVRFEGSNDSVAWSTLSTATLDPGRDSGLGEGTWIL